MSAWSLREEEMIIGRVGDELLFLRSEAPHCGKTSRWSASQGDKAEIQGLVRSKHVKKLVRGATASGGVEHLEYT